MEPKASKRPKVQEDKIMTFGFSNSSVQVELLPKHTLHDLVDIICRNAKVGKSGCDQADEHMWNVEVPGQGIFESGDFECQSELHANDVRLGDLQLEPGVWLDWNYDYGAQCEYGIQFLGEADLCGEEEDFPKKKGCSIPAAYTKLSTTSSGVDLNASFETLNKWAFLEGEGVALNLFQPGKKARNYGFLERSNRCVAHVILMPTKNMRDDIFDYLHYLDHAAHYKYAMADNDPEYPEYEEYSVCVLPEDSATERDKAIWGKEQECGYNEMVLAPPQSGSESINAIFPKVAALAGYVQDPKVMKGWLTYEDKTLLICSGEPRKKTSNSSTQDFGAFKGADQHKPESSSNIVFQVNVSIESLHDLFCVAEGLLQTL